MGKRTAAASVIDKNNVYTELTRPEVSGIESKSLKKHHEYVRQMTENFLLLTAQVKRLAA